MNKQKNALTLSNIIKTYNTILRAPWDRHGVYSKNVCMQAELRHEEDKAVLFAEWRARVKIYENKIFNECKVLNGISKEEFLKRFLLYRPLSNITKTNCNKHLSALCDKLSLSTVSVKSFLHNTDALDSLCSIFSTMELYSTSIDWISRNHEALWRNIADCLAMKDNLIIPEICIATSFLMYTLNTNISEHIIPVFLKLMEIVVEACQDLDDYVISYNDSSETFYMENKKGRVFYFPPYKSKNVDFMLFSTAFYCQTFILNHYLSSNIYDVFLPIIEEMTEVSRYFHLDLLTLSIEHLNELINTRSKNTDLLKVAETIFEYTINFRSDRNNTNKKSIININGMLRNIFQNHNPSVLARLKRKSSNDMKIFITLRKQENESNVKSSANSVLFTS